MRVAQEQAEEIAQLRAEQDVLRKVLHAGRVWLDELGPTYGALSEHALADAIEAAESTPRRTTAAGSRVAIALLSPDALPDHPNKDKP